MYFTTDTTGVSTIGISESTDATSWNIITNNAITPSSVFSPNWTESGVFGPSVIYSDNKYHMWYTSAKSLNRSFRSGESRYRIHYTFSDDGITWGSPILALEPVSNSWESEGVSSPSVIFENNTYKMLYSARDRFGVWRIGYALSTDKTTWTKLGSNPIIESTEMWESSGGHLPGTASPSYIKYKNKYIVLYSTGEQAPYKNISVAVSNSGISWTKYAFNNPVIDSNVDILNSATGNPDAIVIDNQLWVYYSGHDGNKWSIGLAKGDLDIEPKEDKDVIVIVPGMFSSYDPVAFSTCSQTPWQNWKIIPQVSEYNGLTKTLEANGYTLNQNLFLFPYDWRQKITDSGRDLKSFIDSQVIPKNPNSKIDLVGHSLGGLVSRSYLQQYAPDGLIDQIITLGSPHQGVTEAYKAWGGGELPEDGAMRTAASLIVNICKIKTGSLTNKAAIQKSAPVYKDILPTYQYLKGAATHIYLDMDKLGDEFNNGYLKELNNSYGNYSDRFTKITSSSFDVAKVYGVAGYMEDQIRGIYMHGRPTTVLITAPGDKTVLAESASLTNDNYIDVPFDHKGLIYSQQGIQKILETLGISVDISNITAGQPTHFKPSLSLLLRSPATITLSDNNNKVLSSGDKFIFIPNYEQTEYNIKVQGTDTGSYDLVVGQVTEDSSHWEFFKETTNIDKIDKYVISVDPKQPNQPIIKDYNSTFPLISAKLKLAQLQEDNSNPILNQVQQLLTDLDGLEEPIKTAQALRIIRYIGKYYQEVSGTEEKLIALEAIQQIETLLNSLDQKLDLSSAQLKLTKSIHQKKLERLQKNGNASQLLGVNFSQAGDRFTKAKLNKSSNPRLDKIYSYSAYYLIN